MTLAEYLSQEGKTLTELAAQAGLALSTAHDLKTGRRRPSVQLAQRIHERTGLSLHDLRPDVWAAQGAAA